MSRCPEQRLGCLARRQVLAFAQFALGETTEELVAVESTPAKADRPEPDDLASVLASNLSEGASPLLMPTFARISDPPLLAELANACDCTP